MRRGPRCVRKRCPGDGSRRDDRGARRPLRRRGGELRRPLRMTPAPLERIELAGRTLLLKREDTHELGSFKWRGALPTLEEFKRDGIETVITASTGNHGAATAWSAKRLGMRAVVFAHEGA